jgi:hypothetical protein
VNTGLSTTTYPSLLITGFDAYNQSPGPYIFNQDLYTTQSGGNWYINGHFFVGAPYNAHVTFYYVYY